MFRDIPRTRRVAYAPMALTLLVLALASLAGPADAQEALPTSSCSAPICGDEPPATQTAWAHQVATLTAIRVATLEARAGAGNTLTGAVATIWPSTTPAPTIAPAPDADAALPPMTMNWALFAELMGMALCVLGLFGLAAYSLRRWVFRPGPRTLLEQMERRARDGEGGA
jgi:hypothetical protein